MDTEKSVGITIAADGLTCRHDFNSSFGTAIANTHVTNGCWYYEVTLATKGLLQIGWVNGKFNPAPEDGLGVGDCINSYAVDLYRLVKWHGNEERSEGMPYGGNKKWKVGDVIQCYVDLEKKNMSFGINGKNLGLAFPNVDVGEGLYPAFSAGTEEECKFNFGLRKFQYPPPHPYCGMEEARNKKKRKKVKQEIRRQRR